MTDRQMQLNLTNGRGYCPAELRGRRRSRSQRWFELMREAVEAGAEHSVFADLFEAEAAVKVEKN